MIENAEQKGNSIYVYGENNKRLFSKSGQLDSFSPSSISIISSNNTMKIYNTKGTQMASYKFTANSIYN